VGTTTTLAEPPRVDARRRPPGLSLRAVVTGTLVAAFGVGLALRLWLLWHRPLTSDEAIVGLMASQIRHGQMFTFFWGQSYGGVEPYVVALWSFVAGSGAASLNSVPMVLSAVAAVLAWRIGLRVVPAGMRVLAVAAGAVLWVWPDVVIYNSTRELGFRGVTVVTGLAVLLMALRVIERPSPFNIGVLGLVAGIGWWSSPEIIYFAVPAVAYLLFSQRELRSAPRWRLLLLPAGFVIGAAPWLATNLRTGFLSLRTSSSPSYMHSTYTGRLSIFFRDTLAMLLGLRMPLTGAWLGGRTGQVLFLAATVALLVLCVVAVSGFGICEHTAEIRALGIGVLVFPLIFAVFPATSYWQEGQYGVYLVPLTVLLTTGTVAAWLKRPSRVGAPRHRSRSTTAVVCVVATIGVLAASFVSLASFDKAWLGDHPGTFLSGWKDPSLVAEHSIQALETLGVHDAYAEYWVAYDLDYLSRGRLVVTDPYTDRWVAEYYRVVHSPNQDWIFFSPTQTGAASAAFSSSAPGPFGFPETLFTSKLKQLKIAYVVRRAGVLDVVSPARPVTQEQVGIPGPYWP